jgi:hypothetical protein
MLDPVLQLQNAHQTSTVFPPAVGASLAAFCSCCLPVAHSWDSSLFAASSLHQPLRHPPLPSLSLSSVAAPPELRRDLPELRLGGTGGGDGGGPQLLQSARKEADAARRRGEGGGGACPRATARGPSPAAPSVARRRGSQPRRELRLPPWEVRHSVGCWRGAPAVRSSVGRYAGRAWGFGVHGDGRIGGACGGRRKNLRRPAEELAAAMRLVEFVAPVLLALRRGKRKGKARDRGSRGHRATRK